MGISKVKLLKESVEKLTAYVQKHGENVHNMKVWHTHPVCFCEYCVDAVVLSDSGIEFCDFIEESNAIPSKLENRFSDNGQMGYTIMDIAKTHFVDYKRTDALLSDLKHYDHAVTE